MNPPLLSTIVQIPLFLSAPESKLSIELEVMLKLFADFPEIEKSIAADQDSHAKKKKAIRLEDKRWKLRKQEECYTNKIFSSIDQDVDESNLELRNGRNGGRLPICQL